MSYCNRCDKYKSNDFCWCEPVYYYFPEEEETEEDEKCFYCRDKYLDGIADELAKHLAYKDADYNEIFIKRGFKVVIRKEDKRATYILRAEESIHYYSEDITD